MALAQLRDAKTGECIAEGAAEEMVLLASEVGTAEVMFDGVGVMFDPAQTLQKHRDLIQKARMVATEVDGDERPRAVERAERLEAIEQNVRGRRAAARDALRAARKLAKLES